VLILDRSKIEQLVDFERSFDAISSAYCAASSGKVNLPPVGHITFPDHGGDCHIKYGHVEGDEFFVIKVATGFPNYGKNDLPNGNGIMLILSAQTGEVISALHDEMHLTDVRTGIGGATGSHLLAKRSSKKVLIVGTGIQAEMQINAHAAKFDHALEFTIWGRDTLKAQSLASRLDSSLKVSVVADLEQACKQSDIIVTTTTSTKPFIKADWINPGTHITAIGADAPGKQELMNDVAGNADLIVADSISQCIDHGEIEEAATKGLIDQSAVLELGNILTNPKLGRKSDNQITLADFTGIAALDIAMAKIIWQSYHQSSNT
jgi:ornithine cyclodeaminase/alanine dehydrogenase-like protein (mu-crystallin family)